MRTPRLIGAALSAGLVLASVSACGDDKKSEDKSPATTVDLKGVTLEVGGSWQAGGGEQTNFQKVLDDFQAKTGATVKFTSSGDKLVTVLASKIQGGSQPDVAMMPNKGALDDFAKKGWLKPLSADVKAEATKNFAPIWNTLGSTDGNQYGVYFKAANKSTVWYRPQAFEDAGVQPPKTWAELITASGTLADSGVAPFSVAGATGWTLTDWFENIYLSQAGPENYDKLAKHEIPWTDASVKQALTTLGQLWGKKEYLNGGQTGALQTDFPTSVVNTFKAKKAAMVYEGDFVAGVIASDAGAKVGTDAKFFPFPAVGQNAPVVSGGDAAVILKDSKGAQELVKYLASPAAVEIWTKLGGITSPNKNVDLKTYPDDIQRSIAQSVVDAGDNVRFDMSDLAPASFGGTDGAGEWKLLQDFLKNPADVDGISAKLEAAAAKAYK
ncbi:ABC transporter substrate-binding protein [Actinocorallia longicatena]|uniref:ABC transporter substrate-binding protein n=1 Tax=Actinocorallia longicatena TaxID=111803 RepID=A0ABP6Q5S1_9ACTN